MRNATDLMAQYALYHRDRRNIVSHFIGVPMIVFAVQVLLGRTSLMVGEAHVTLALVAWLLASIWYLTRGDFLLGAATAVSTGVLLVLAHRVTGGSVSTWLAWGFGFFVVGWLIQSVGHWYEGKRPAFVDDVVGLLVAPMFVTAEAMFLCGWNKPLLHEIERRSGKTVLRDIARIA